MNVTVWSGVMLKPLVSDLLSSGHILACKSQFLSLFHNLSDSQLPTSAECQQRPRCLVGSAEFGFAAGGLLARFGERSHGRGAFGGPGP